MTTYAELQEEIENFQTILEDIANVWDNTAMADLGRKRNEDLAKRRDDLRKFLHKHAAEIEYRADRGI